MDQWWVVALVVLGVLVVSGLGFYGVTAPRLRRRQAKADLTAAGLVPVSASKSPPAQTPSRAKASPRESTAASAKDSMSPDPEALGSRLVRLRARLAGSNTSLGKGLLGLLTRDNLDQDTWEQLEDLLLQADVGVEPTQELVAKLRAQVQVLGSRQPEQVRQLLRQALLEQVDPQFDRSLATTDPQTPPSVVLVVGVNGTGKTTTVAKLARALVAEQQHVVLGAADTFRAAAADQLQTWGDRVGVSTVRGPEGSDPASVAHDAVARGVATGADVVLIDTAGRLHNKVGLMDELGKVKRVVEKQHRINEVLLVLDATTGQNGLVQARVFAKAVEVTGIVLTKLDGSAKGGIVISVQRELGVPVKLVGLGEGADDLAPFAPEAFVDALLGPET